MDENILETVKQMIGCEEDYRHFERQIIMCINTAFSILFQLGVGPKNAPFAIVDGTETWGQFVGEEKIEAVKNYVAIRVQKMFDPPTSSVLMNALNEIEKELEWRLNVMSETP